MHSDTEEQQATARIYISPKELQELSRCYICNCSTEPLCTWEGEPCKECFDVFQFAHRAPDKSCPGKYQHGVTEGGERIVQVSDDAKIEQYPTVPAGDCLYECVAIALNTLVSRKALKKITIAELRSFVARHQTEDNFVAYSALAQTHSEYQCVKNMKTLRQFKNVVKQCGEDVGVNNCLWGDENSLTIFAEGYHFRFAVFSEKGHLIQQITPSSNTITRTILLRLNGSHFGSEHFSLLTLGGRAVLQPTEWDWLQNKLNC